MEEVFPFGFPGPTALYLTLYVITLVVHVVFMHYVLAGSAYLACVSLFTGGEDVQRQRNPTALLLRDWLPFMLGLAITAGVAPLLFVQILYQKSFYTANLLLFHRWMAVLPVLIVGYYLVYLLKSKRITYWSVTSRLLAGCGAFGCFAFTAYSWTENHLLSQQSQAVWAAHYDSAKLLYWHPLLLPRLGVMFCAAFPTLAALVGWQMWVRKRRGTQTTSGEPRRAANLALGGLLGAVLCAGLYYLLADTPSRAVFGERLVLPYLIAAGLGLVLQLVGWWWQRPQALFSARQLILVSAGTILTLTGLSVVREGIRLSAADLTRLYAEHEAAAGSGGFLVFLIFLVINSIAITAVLLIIKRRLELQN